MKSISIAEAKSDMEAVLVSAQKERIVILRSGKPCAVVVGIESYDAEDMERASSPEFWRMIEERRQGPSIPLAELKERLKKKTRKKGVKK